MEVDATKSAWRIDVAEYQSLDSEAWISWRLIRRSQRGGLVWPNIEAWIPKLGFLGGGCDEAGVEDWCGRKSKLGFQSLDFLEVDATKSAWMIMIDVTKYRSLDSESWIS